MSIKPLRKKVLIDDSPGVVNTRMGFAECVLLIYSLVSVVASRGCPRILGDVDIGIAGSAADIVIAVLSAAARI